MFCGAPSNQQPFKIQVGRETGKENMKGQVGRASRRMLEKGVKIILSCESA